MPRLSAPADALRAAPRRNLRPVGRGGAKARPKKPAPMLDRLSASTLFFRRVRRSLKPGLWTATGVAAVFLIVQLHRAIPSVAPVVSPAGSLRHDLGGLAARLGFRITEVRILGADTTKLPAIQAALGVRPGDPIFGFSLRGAEARIEQLGPIETATVERALPGSIVVTVAERAAYAIWQTGGSDGAPGFVVIDREGNVIADQDAVAAKRRNPALLLLAGPDAPRMAGTLIRELAAAPAVGAHVAAAQRIDGLRWNLVLRNDTLVKLPVDGEAQAIAALGRMQAGMALLDRPVEVIDLRLAGRMAVRPYPNADAPPPRDAGGVTGHDKGSVR